MRIKKKQKFDYILAVVVAVLVILGILVLASVSAAFSQEKFGRTTYYLFHQMICGLALGIILGFVAFKIKLSTLKKWAWLFILINLIFMAGFYSEIGYCCWWSASLDEFGLCFFSAF